MTDSKIFRYPSRGACIYCGITGVTLTDEHVVPLSLGGRHILTKASCLSCADQTKKFEQEVARNMWGDARIAYNAPTRRKKERPSHIKLKDHETGKVVVVPYDEYPAPFIFYKMTRAGILEGMPETVDQSPFWTFEAITDSDKCNEFERKYGIKVPAKFKNMPVSFSQMIAKIGYGQILTALDPSDFRAICVPFILGQRGNPSFLVGCSPVNEPPDVDIGYRMKTMGFGNFSHLILVAEIRLLANCWSPTYHVVVGEVVGPERVASALLKLGEVSMADIPPYLALSSLPNEHWLPARWPLPPC